MAALMIMVVVTTGALKSGLGPVERCVTYALLRF